MISKGSFIELLVDYVDTFSVNTLKGPIMATEKIDDSLPFKFVLSPP